MSEKDFHVIIIGAGEKLKFFRVSLLTIEKQASLD